MPFQQKMTRAVQVWEMPVLLARGGESALKQGTDYGWTAGKSRQPIRCGDVEQ